MCKVIAYYRVSTEGQGRSGLGLDAQRQAVTALCQSRDWQIMADYTEVESGKSADRKQLIAALHHARPQTHYVSTRCGLMPAGPMQDSCRPFDHIG